MSATGRHRWKRAHNDPAAAASVGHSARSGRCGGAASRRARTDRRRCARTASRTQPKHDVGLPLRGILRALHASLPTPCGRRAEAELTTLFGSGTGLGNGRQTSQGKAALITGVEHARLFNDEGAKAILMNLAEEAGSALAKARSETLLPRPQRC
jgi:hypothetical protein